jgi:ubiquinol-cytochrome c reductase cytochrome b subunit
VLQGGGNMPAYGNALNPSETKALVSFLTTLRGNDLAPAGNPALDLTHTGKLQSSLSMPPSASKKP